MHFYWRILKKFAQNAIELIFTQPMQYTFKKLEAFQINFFDFLSLKNTTTASKTNWIHVSAESQVENITKQSTLQNVPLARPVHNRQASLNFELHCPENENYPEIPVDELQMGDPGMFNSKLQKVVTETGRSQIKHWRLWCWNLWKIFFFYNWSYLGP